MTTAPTPMRRSTLHTFELLIATLLLLAVAGAVLAFRHEVFGTSSSSTIQGSGVASSQVRELPAFGSVELAGSNNVSIEAGGKQAVVLYGDDNLLSRITTHVSKGRLLIGNVPGNFATKTPMHVDVRVPSLKALALSGSGVVAASGVRSPHLTATVDGSGVLRAGGTVGRLDVAVAGSGDVQLENLAAGEVHAVVTGSGRIVVNAIRTLDASVPGSGAIVYRGNPKDVHTTVTGTGTVVPG